jgi:hypothetical protein
MTKRVHEDIDALLDSLCRRPDVDVRKVLHLAGLDAPLRGLNENTPEGDDAAVGSQGSHGGADASAPHGATGPETGGFRVPESVFASILVIWRTQHAVTSTGMSNLLAILTWAMPAFKWSDWDQLEESARVPKSVEGYLCPCTLRGNWFAVRSLLYSSASSIVWGRFALCNRESCFCLTRGLLCTRRSFVCGGSCKTAGRDNIVQSLPHQDEI